MRHLKPAKVRPVYRHPCLWLLTALAIIAVCEGCAGSGDYPEATHYRNHGDTLSLNHTLHRYIRPGDHVNRIKELLGPGDRSDQQVLMRVQRDFARQVPSSYPDDVADTDYFLAYHAKDECSIVLQFRDDRLVNFNPEKVPDGE